jgi:hypothetical protein
MHLFLRILNPNESIHDSSYRKQQLDDSILTLQFLVLPPDCFHVFFERQFSSPFWPALFLMILVSIAVPFVMVVMIICSLAFPDVALSPFSSVSSLLAQVLFLTFVILRL